VPITTNCPSCDRAVRIPEDLLGSKVRCPACKTVFTAEAPEDEAASPRPEPPASVTERPTPASARPPVPRRRIEQPDDARDPYEDEPDDYEERPRRKRGASRERVRGMVMGPAISLIVVGCLGLLLAIANTAVQVIGNRPPGGLGAPPAGKADPAYEMGQKVGGYVGACAGFPWALVILLGGIQMLRLRTRASAMTASIVSMVPCSLCCIIGLPIGIWSLIVLNKPEVVRAFE
jgi:predicted Zn finger-like uncharacterized protein